MRIGIQLNHTDDFLDTIDEIVAMERVGLGIALVAELYGFDAVSRLGYLAARTNRLELGAGVLQIFTRTPTATAMTAAGLDHVSRGRFTLGLGASGPQVIEGFHGVRYDAPLRRTREVIEICRRVWRREVLRFDGERYRIPLPADSGTGLGKPLKLINRPVRHDIPVLVAALGPKNVELAAEVADGWLPVMFHPDKHDLVWRDALHTGAAKRDPALRPLQIFASPFLAIGEDTERHYLAVKRQIALYVGGMGAKGKNFYNELLVRYGYPDEAARIQDLFLTGRREEAEVAVPDQLVRELSLIGTESFVASRVAAFAAAGVTTLNVRPLADTSTERIAQIDRLHMLISSAATPPAGRRSASR